MNILPEGRTGAPATQLSGTPIFAGVLVAYGAFAVLISLVAGFANGAHANQQLSGASWKQLGTGGGIVTAVVLFLAWAAGGFVAGRLAGRDGVRYGAWVFVVGVVLMTVVGAAVTWLPDTATILRNLRLLGLPLRRTEWRDVASVAGILSLTGMAAGAIVGAARGARLLALAPAATAPVVAEPAFEPEPVPAFAPEPEPEPAFAEPSLFQEYEEYQEVEEFQESVEAVEPMPPPGPEPEPVPEPMPVPGPMPEPAAPAEPAEQPAWLTFIEERERAIRERDSAPAFEDDWAQHEPASLAESEAAPWADRPPEFIEDAPEPEPDPGARPGSWWPQEAEPAAAQAYDEAWALPDEQPPPGEEAGLAFAFPPRPSTIEPEPEPEPEPAADDLAEPPPLAEHADWPDDRGLFQAPPDPGTEDALQHAPEAAMAQELDPEEEEARQRQREDAARAYEQAREEQ